MLFASQGMRTKRGDAGIGWIFALVIILIFIVWLAQYSARGCHTNADCGDNSYCGSDFACHQYPVQKIVERQVIEASGAGNGLVLPALIIGAAIVIAAWLVRWRNEPHRPDSREKRVDSQQFEHYGENVHEEKHGHH